MPTPTELARVREALAKADTKYLDPKSDSEKIRVLSQALRDRLKRELVTSA